MICGMWTRFMDMHSGGGSKEPYSHIIIEADTQDEAEIIFYNRFGHNPNRVTCTCCGEDYSISSQDDLAQITAYDRGCIYASNSEDYPAPPDFEGRYFEAKEDIPEGWFASNWPSHDPHRSLEEYLELDHVLIIRAEEVKAEEKEGSLPEQGYVWVD